MATRKPSTKPAAEEQPAPTPEAEAAPAPAPAAQAQPMVEVPAEVLALADHTFAGPLVARAVSLAEGLTTELRASFEERSAAGPDANLATIHGALLTTGTSAIDAIREMCTSAAGAKNGELSKLVGNVSRWNQKSDPDDRSALADFCDTASVYRKARKLHAASIGDNADQKSTAKLAELAAPLATAAIDTSELRKVCAAAIATGNIDV